MKSLAATRLARSTDKRQTKYGNTRVKTAAGTFDSKAEYARWLELHYLQKAGKISALKRQVRYPLLVNGLVIGHYVADFVYEENGEEIIEDVKGQRTQLFIWKAKHLLAQYGKQIILVKR